MFGLHQDKRRSGNEADYPRGCRWHVAWCTKRAEPCSPRQRTERVSAFRARVSLSGSMPGRLADRDVDAVTYAFVACSASPGKPPGIGRAIPRTSPLAETRSWTPPAAHPRSAAAETCLGAPESWVLEDYHEPAVFSYGWRPFSRHLAVIGDLRIQDCQHKRRFAFRSDLCHCARE